MRAPVQRGPNIGVQLRQNEGQGGKPRLFSRLRALNRVGRQPPPFAPGPVHGIIRTPIKWEVSLHRIIVLMAALALMVSFSGGSAFAQAKKGKVNCSMEACTAGCNKNGGQPRFCGDYCAKQMSQRKAEGKC